MARKANVSEFGIGRTLWLKVKTGEWVTGTVIGVATCVVRVGTANGERWLNRQGADVYLGQSWRLSPPK